MYIQTIFGHSIQFAFTTGSLFLCRFFISSSFFPNSVTFWSFVMPAFKCWHNCYWVTSFFKIYSIYIFVECSISTLFMLFQKSTKVRHFNEIPESILTVIIDQLPRIDPRNVSFRFQNRTGNVCMLLRHKSQHNKLLSVCLCVVETCANPTTCWYLVG